MHIKIDLNIKGRDLVAPVSPAYLGFCRMVMFGWLFLWYLFTDFQFIAEYPSAMWDAIPILSVIGLDEQPSHAIVFLLKSMWLITLFLACIGLFTRTSIFFAFLFGSYMLAATHSFFKVNHSDAGLLIAMFLLIFARCGDSFSLDAIRRSVRDKDFKSIASVEYAWPIHMLRLVWVIIFFLAGLAKLRRSGLEWILTDNMSNLLLRKQVAWEPPTEIGTFIAQYPWLCILLAGGAVAIELGSPLVLFSNIARAIIVPSMLLMQIGILFLMGDDFTQFMSLYVFFVPWIIVAAHLLRFVPTKPIDVLYDGKCGLCGRTIAVLRRIDLLGRLRYRDVVGDWQAVHADHPQVDREAALQDMHVINSDGRVDAGFDGYRLIAWAVPLGWLFLPLLYLPGVSYAGDRVYRWVADRRHGAGQCTIKPEE